MTLAVHDLSDHPRFIPQLADAVFAEWPEWCARVGRPAVERIFASGAGGSLPVILVAHEGDRLLGTVALRPWFAEEPMDETPWVRQLLVLPRYRGYGAYPALAAAIEARARELGFARLHAATNRIVPLLVRRGWAVFREVEVEGEKLAWLRKTLSRL